VSRWSGYPGLPRAQYLTALLVGLTTFLVYLPALKNGFVTWDDNYYIYKNDHIRHLGGAFFKWALTSFYASNWHPLTWFSHALDYSLWGLNPRGHHLSSIVLHAANAFLVTLVTFNLLWRRPSPGTSTFANRREVVVIAGLTGLLFGLHPLHVESVAWISERKDLLCAFFYLLSLDSYLRLWRRTHTLAPTGEVMGRRDYHLSLAFLALALMSKPMAVSLPCVLLLVDWFRGSVHGRGEWSRRLCIVTPFFLLALASCAVTIAAQKSGGAINTLTDAPLSDRVMVAAYALTVYIQKMVWPVQLVPYYAYPASVKWYSAQFLGSALLVLVCSGVALVGASRWRAWTAAWAYYVVTLLPVLGIIKVGGQAFADRYTYLPSIAPFVLVSGLAVWGVRRIRLSADRRVRRFLGPVAAVLLALLGTLPWLTQQQIHVWKNSETLWRYVIRHDDRIPFAYGQLGIGLFEQGRYGEAAEEVSKALSQRPFDATLLNTLAVSYLELDNLEGAMRAVRRALSVDPDSVSALNTLGEVYLRQGEVKKANKTFMRAMRLDPGNPLRVFNLAVSFDALQDRENACNYWRRYMLLDDNGKNDAEIMRHLADIGCPLNH